MAKNKNLGLKILAVCSIACLAMIPTTALSQIPSNVYNPLADINEDGKVSLQDLILLANAYGTNGTPTNITKLENQVTALQTQVGELLNDFSLYNQEFGSVSLVIPSINFSPPVSVYHALRTALESNGWNKSTLIDQQVSVYLEYNKFFNPSPMGWGYQLLHDVTQPVEDYSPVEVNGTYGNLTYTTVYRYVWTICVVYIHALFPHGWPYYFVDAATAEIVQHFPSLG